MKKLTERQLEDIRYFWKYNGDLERYTSFEELKPAIQEEYPEILKAWYDYKTSIRIMDLVIENLEFKTE